MRHTFFDRVRAAAILICLCATVGIAQAQTGSALPLRIGADQAGGNGFRGAIAAVRLYGRPLSATEIKKLSAGKPNQSVALPGLVGQWLFGEGKEGLVLNDPGLPARRVGDFHAVTLDEVTAVRGAGGWFEVTSDARLALTGGTVEAWIRPEPGSSGRIVDRIPPGGTDGWLLDMFPGDGLRVILGPETFTQAVAFTEKWTHVAVTVGASGVPGFFINGALIAGEAGEDLELTGAAEGPRSAMTLWYRQPARRWTEASVIGNGRLGGMVWGGISRERIDLNEDTLWSGEPYENLNPKGLAALPGIRALLLAGKNAEAQALVESDMNGKYNQCYMPMGQLSLEFPIRGQVKDYRRELDLEQGVTRVRFVNEATGYTRETFASYPDQAIVTRLSTDRPGKLTLRASLGSQLRHSVIAEGERVLRMTGRVPVHADPHYVGKNIRYDDGPDAKGMRFETRLLVLNEGGKVRVSEEGVEAQDCDSLTLILVAGTSYKGPHRSPSREGRDPARECERDLKQLRAKSYAQMRAEHVADHGALFGRVRLDVGRSEADKQPTDLRLRQYQPGADPSLAALYFQFGRYLLIAGSRPGSQPLNLQGIWNKDVNPAWSANWTLNCNAQINYWPVEVANLAECHEPLVDLTCELSTDGTNIAKNLYGAGGWVAHHNTDIWRQAGPVSGSACWSVFQVGGAWLCQHLWEHYAFSRDEDYLRRVFPVLAGATRFFLDSLIEEPSHRWLVTAPDVNFENAFKKPDGNSACSCYGPTASMQMVRELMQNTLKADTVLGAGLVFRGEIEAALPRLAPMQVSPTTGELQEWVEDWQRTAECQVLSSWGAVCSAQITPEQTPDLAAGLRRIFDAGGWWKRGSVGSWQGAFQANVYARLHCGDEAMGVLNTHLARVVNPNLSANFGGMAEWEIDGNMGLTAAVCEMLLQSQTGELELLPALPSAWRTGSVQGLRARGGLEVDIAWKEGKLSEAMVRGLTSGDYSVRYGSELRRIKLGRGETYRWKAD